MRPVYYYPIRGRGVAGQEKGPVLEQGLEGELRNPVDGG